jgi:gas vesicle protein
MGKRFTIGVVIGVIAGSIAGMLTAPKSGRETRDDLRRKAGELKDQVTEAAYDAKDVAGGYAERGERAAKEAVRGARRGFFRDKKEDE